MTARALKRTALAALALAAAGTGVLAWRTAADLEPLPATLAPAALPGAGDARGAGGTAAERGVRALDRRGEPLNATFTSDWNVYDEVPLHEIPPFLRAAFLAAEDKRFFEHAGVDWRARTAALWANIESGRAVRGASTITEQVVRMLHGRPRTVWSRWLEGFEAHALEQRFTKNEILEFYLNQVPYAANRRGVRQAASYYFARDLGTLSRKEMLALAVLVRSPTRLDLKRGERASEGAIERLAAALAERGELPPDERDRVLADPLALEAPHLTVAAPHFLRYARQEWRGDSPVDALPATLHTTLDGRLQSRVQELLDERMRHLAPQHVANGAVLVVDHTTGEVLAWVVAGGGGRDGPVSFIDAVTTPRQPGSALKPFLYALAIDRGFTAADVIDDAPLAESTADGLHSYQNYSRRFYGPVSLRDALGNSLNIPALKTLQWVGAEPYLETLASLGFEGLTDHPDVYGDGIALGSGAVALRELVAAYAALANGGVARPLTTRLDAADARPARRVFSAEAASLVANILADPNARALEFGRDSVLALPVQTAVKTGTSSDYRDAWTVGFNYRYAVGVWMGNLDDSPTEGLTGATGPALLLRSVLAELARDAPTRPLYLSPRLVRAQVCVPMPLRDVPDCLTRDEWFLPGTEPAVQAVASTPARGAVRLRQPTPGLKLAFDPRLPAESQAFEFALDGVAPSERVIWTVDGAERLAAGDRYSWTVTRGEHRVVATVWRGAERVTATPETVFTVK